MVFKAQNVSLLLLIAQVDPQRPTTIAGHADNLCVLCWIIGLNEGVDGFLDQTIVQLGSRQLTPHSRVIATLCKLICSVQVTHVFYQYL